MNDLISRQAAIETMSDMRCEVNCFDRDERKTYETLNRVIRALTVLPSAQPEQIARDIATIIENEQDMRVILKNAEYTETHECDCERTETHDLVSRDAVIKAILQLDNLIYTVPDYIDAVRSVPTAEPESRREWYMKGYRDAQNAALHESCTDCPLYDHDRHNCPRFNKVIPRAIEEVKPRWIPCEERLPEEQDEYLVTWVAKLHTGKRFVGIGIFEYDLSEDNWIFDDYMNAYIDVTVTAWMPLPPSYKGDEDERN